MSNIFDLTSDVEKTTTTNDNFDFDQFVGSEILPEGQTEMELLKVMNNNNEIRLSFRKQGYRGIATEMISKHSVSQGWVLAHWQSVFGIARPKKGITKSECFDYFATEIEEHIGQHFQVDVTRAETGETLFNGKTVPNS